MDVIYTLHLPSNYLDTYVCGLNKLVVESLLAVSWGLIIRGYRAVHRISTL